jgi:hypothetical protein
MNDKKWRLVATLWICGALATGCGKDDDTDDGGDDGTTTDGGTSDDGAGSGTSDGSDTGDTGGGDTTGDSGTGDGGSATGGVEPPEIVGTYTDSWDVTHIIAEGTWTQESADATETFQYTIVDNEADFLVAQNGPDNEWYPGLWSRFDWTVTDGDRLWFCQETFGANTEEDALNAPPPSRDDPENTGCGDWGWTELLEQ